MNKKFLIWKNPWQAILWIVGTLMFIGCINSFSASYEYNYSVKYIVITAASIILTFFSFRKGYKRYLQDSSLLIFTLVLIGTLILVAVMGLEVKGAKRWIYIGPFGFQPSEFVKLLVVIIGAKYLGPILDRNEELHLLDYRKWGSLGVALFFSGMVLFQPDMGTAAIILGLAVVMYYLAGMKKGEIAFSLGLGISAMLLVASLKSYRLDRFRIWLDPWSDRLGDGYQSVQSFLAIGSGGIIGFPWGQGPSKLYLPEAHTDFAFAIFCQENGFVGCLFLVLVILIFSCALQRISVNAKSGTSFLLGSGISFLLVGQSIANMAMVCGLLPVIGVPFPFVSYGGSSLLTSILSLGFIYAIFREGSGSGGDGDLPSEKRREKLQVVGRRGQIYEE